MKTKWTKEKCYEIAKKYKTLKEFSNNEQNCYVACVKHKYIKEFDWLIRKRKNDGYWSKERCYQEAEKYDTIKDFETNSKCACVISRRNGWMEDYVWLTRLVKPSGYWRNKDNVFDAARKCKTKYEFCKIYPTAYDNAKKYKWLEEMVWLKPTIINVGYTDYCIYSYVDEENKVAYVGLTHNKERRHNEHLTHVNGRGKQIYSAPNKYFSQINKPLPNPIYLEDKLTAEEAQIAEEKWVNYYKGHNYKMLNKGKVGKNVSGLGGGILIWTKEKCFEESKKYTSRNEFKDGCCGAYRTSIKYGWIDEMKWLIPRQKPNRYWKNKDNIINASKMCEKRSHFKKKYPNAYQWAKEYDMLDDLFPKH